MWQKLSKCYPPTLELISILLLVLAIYIAFSNYSSLPERIPVDFNSQGIPEEWANKNMIFLYPSLGIFIYLGFTTINIWFAVTKKPKSLINMPNKWKDSLNDSQAEELRVILNRYLFALKIVIQSLILYLLYASIEVALEETSSIGGTAFTLITLAILVVTSFLMVRELIRIIKTPEPNTTWP
tara:strand:- start:873 stop:1421 length:549 start_codon:yes stop_codon:yes gene_type:complete